MQSALLEKKVDKVKSKSVKSMPKVVVSSKLITQDKKNVKVRDRDGNFISMEEMQKKSMEGQRKGGR